MSLSPDQKLAAYFLGRRIAGQRRKQDRVPVAYLYNGVRLPALPSEWNPVTHPFAWVRKGSFGGGYWLYIHKEINYVLSDSGAECISISPSDTLRYVWYSDSAEWSLYPVTESGMVATVDWKVWANFDMLSTTGDLVIAASDPVPVYE